MPRTPFRLSLAAVLVCATGFLAACQTGGPGGSGKPSSDVTPNAVAGDPIEVMALDDPAGEGAAPASVPAETGASGTAVPQPAAAEPSEPPTETAPSAVAADPAPQPDLAATPVTPKSEQQLACEKRKGSWLRVGDGDARACVFQTRDAGKRCERESQCDSVCLARSGTCAPFKPMYGCNDILQDNGMRVTLCLD